MKDYRKTVTHIMALVCKHAFALALALLALSIMPQSLKAQSLDRIERERAGQMLIMLKDDIKKNYYDPSYHGVDVDARFETAQQKLKQATSLGQAFGIVAQTLLDFNDSHTFFIPPSRPGIVEYGWEMEMIGDKCFVTAVKPKSDAEKQGVKPGDEVLSVEDFKPTRKEFWKMQYYYEALSPRRGLHVTLQSPGSEPRELDVAAQVREGNIMDDNLVRKQRPRPHRFQQVGGDVTVWKMGEFDLEDAEVDTRMGRVKTSRALIFDMRDNGGGYETTLLRLLSHFFDNDLKVGDIKRRKEEKPLIAKKLKSSNPYTGKVIILLNSQSGSAAELFARVMQIEKRAVVLGDHSSGSVMRAKWNIHEVGDSRVVVFGASITDADVVMTDGKSLEHVGVVPDEMLLPTGADLAAGRDPVLARALEMVGVQITSEKAGALFPVQW